MDFAGDMGTQYRPGTKSEVKRISNRVKGIKVDTDLGPGAITGVRYDKRRGHYVANITLERGGRTATDLRFLKREIEAANR